MDSETIGTTSVNGGSLSGTQPVLNHDVLIAIMSVSCRDTVAKLMRTCWTLYRAGAKFILANNVIHIADGSKPDNGLPVSKFCRFLSAQGGRRLPYLHYLHIGHQQPLDFVFIALLADASQLRALSLQDTEDLLASYPPLIRVISQELPSLRYLCFREAGEQASEVLRQMHTPLETLDVDFDRDEVPAGPWGPVGYYWHPTVLCANFADSLQSLNFTNLAQNEPAGTDTVYPKVHTLLLEDDTPLARPYIRSFPNVKTLHVYSTREEWHSSLHNADMAFLSAHRQRNIDNQLSRGTWPTLEVFTGNVIGLFMLGLACHVRRLVFKPVEPWTLQLLRPAMDSVRPEYLELWFRLEDLVEQLAREDAGENTGPPRVLSFLGAASLKQLELRISVWKADFDEDVSHPMATIRNALHSVSQLTSLRIGLYPSPTLGPRDLPNTDLDGDDEDSEESGRSTPSAHDGTPPLPARAESSLMAFDPESYARDIAAEVPSLQSVQIAVEGPCHGYVWIACLDRFARSEANVRCQKRTYAHYTNGIFQWL
ncbi:hypothetical protein BD413DRAFT_562195 [Trametes elegans]|nr:hypothetical protein BD413DRAFT_562195 [Trametes elegans]